jgi:enamine deaminase RidA (YjgF/YER057c/UK114 family)
MAGKPAAAVARRVRASPLPSCRRYCCGMPSSLVRSSRLSDVAEYAYAAVVDSPGRLVFTAGACPLDAQGRTVAVGDYAGQARVVMENLRVALQDAGADLADVVKSTVYVASTDRRDLVASWEVVRDAFGDHDPPSTLLGVAMLGYADQLVEVEAVAAVSA